MTTGENTHGCDYFTSPFLLPQLYNSTGNKFFDSSVSRDVGRLYVATVTTSVAPAACVRTSWLSSALLLNDRSPRFGGPFHPSLTVLGSTWWIRTREKKPGSNPVPSARQRARNFYCFGETIPRGFVNLSARLTRHTIHVQVD